MLRQIALAVALAIAGASAVHAQAYHDPVTQLKAPLEGTRIYDKFGRNSLDIWDDGTIGVHDMTAQPWVQVVSGCSNVGSQQVTTIKPTNGPNTYITSLFMQQVENGSVTAQTNLAFTSTGLGGVTWGYSSPGTANTTTNLGPFTFKPPMKALIPGSTVTISSPTGTANTAFCITATYYQANS